MFGYVKVSTKPFSQNYEYTPNFKTQNNEHSELSFQRNESFHYRTLELSSPFELPVERFLLCFANFVETLLDYSKRWSKESPSVLFFTAWQWSVYSNGISGPKCCSDFGYWVEFGYFVVLASDSWFPGFTCRRFLSSDSKCTNLLEYIGCLVELSNFRESNYGSLRLFGGENPIKHSILCPFWSHES